MSLNINCIILKLLNKHLKPVVFDELRDKRIKHLDEFFVKIRFSNVSSKRSRSCEITLENLKIILVNIFGENILLLLKLEELNCDKIYVKFHNKPKNILDNFNELMLLVEKNNYSNIEIYKGVIKDVEINNKCNLKIKEGTSSHDIIYHNEKGFSHIELYQNKMDYNQNHIKYIINNTEYTISHSFEIIQIFNKLEEKYKKFGKIYEFECETVMLTYKDDTDEIIQDYYNPAYPAYHRLTKLNNIFEIL